MTKKENDCCCCCIQHERNCHKANAETPNEPIVGSKLKSDTNAIICEICGEFVPKGFGNVKRLRCPCHASKTGDGLFHSHSQEYLGIYVSQSDTDFSSFFFFAVFFFQSFFSVLIQTHTHTHSARSQSTMMKTIMEKNHREIQNIHG